MAKAVKTVLCKCPKCGCENRYGGSGWLIHCYGCHTKFDAPILNWPPKTDSAAASG